MSQKILNAVHITINSHKAHAFIDSDTIHDDLISGNIYFHNKIPTDARDAKPLETAIEVRRSIMMKKATIELNIQGNKIRRIFYASSLRDWHATLVQHMSHCRKLQMGNEIHRL